MKGYYLLSTIITLAIISCIYSCQQSPNINDNSDSSAINNQKDSISLTPIDSTEQVIFNKENYTWKDGYIVMDWEFLSKVVFDEKYINDTLALVPIFHDSIRILEGKPLQIAGFCIPFGEKTGKLHFLSAFPMSECFFCGAAGPESVMDVMTAKVHHEFKMDDRLTFRGTLHLNDYNLEYMNYILKDAELVSQ